MLNIDEINKEIEALEKSNNTSYSTCQKLAILYIVRDHMGKREESVPVAPSPLMMEKSAITER